MNELTTALHTGDAAAVLAAMPDASADCIVTSPPYWGKRDYRVTGQYGHEPSPAAYVDTLRQVFHQAWRVLADDGTCWLNLADTYTERPGPTACPLAYSGAGPVGPRVPGLAAKNLLGLPWRVAFALQGDGWTLRNAIVWHKPNAMPESVRDRLNCRYELVFLLVKSRYYWFDLDPIRIPHATRPPRRCTGSSPATTGPASSHPGGTRRPPGMPVIGRHTGTGMPKGTRPGSRRHNGAGPGNNLKYSPQTREVIGARRYPNGRRHPNGRNPGDVWPIPTRPYRGPHFAAFPIDLPTRCITAGCKPGGTVLDPFCGTGTTGLAALALGRHFTGIDLNPAFTALAAERLRHAAQPGTGNEGR
jgi:DNA modification methylase